MHRRFYEAGSNWIVVLLIAAAPLLCCCSMLASMATAAEQDPAAGCNRCTSETTPSETPAEAATPARSTGDSDEPCECEHEKLLLMLPAQPDAQKLAALEWQALATWLLSPWNLQGPEVHFPVPHAADSTPQPGVTSLLTLRCLLTT